MTLEGHEADSQVLAPVLVNIFGGSKASPRAYASTRAPPQATPCAYAGNNGWQPETANSSLPMNAVTAAICGPRK